MKFLLGTLAAGYAGGRATESLIKKAYHNKKEKKGKVIKNLMIKKNVETNFGVCFSVGDIINVAKVDDDMVLVELQDDNDNPYIFSKRLVEEMTDTRLKF